ncbi:DUF2059 domain-containing protein [Rhizobium sp. LjRoot30]|uniref:DUF2059 domain-containing protein n=1 Tax=Rhizobium sp. LjRoot30 TaxID=3342320 RepID=UPI003ED09ADA
MTKFAGFGRFAAAAIVLTGVAFGSAAHAQEISEAQIAAAKAAIQSLNLTAQFDNILPTVAERLKAQLIQASPNYTDMITATVDEKALALASRRGDLEREAATIYAKSFTTEELNAVAAFYQSDVGKKLLSQGPVATREMMKAADIWASGITRDLANESDAALEKQIGEQVKAQGDQAQQPAQQ